MPTDCADGHRLIYAKKACLNHMKNLLGEGLAGGTKDRENYEGLKKRMCVCGIGWGGSPTS